MARRLPRISVRSSVRAADAEGSARKVGGATRLCRQEPLLSNQSNKWGELRTLKAFRPKADVHNAVCKPWPQGFHQLGSRGNPAPIEHRRRRQTRKIAKLNKTRQLR